MTIFELVKENVTARQAAERYGLRFDRTGRGFCPWHDDGRHAALQFFRDGCCYCHSCHQGGDATALVAQMLGVSEKEAAKQICSDWALKGPITARPELTTQIKAKAEKALKSAFAARWKHLCEVVREADEKLATFSPETAGTEFEMILAARNRANEELDIMWEEIKDGSAR